MNQQNKCILALTLAEGVGPIAVKRVLEQLAYYVVTIEALQSMSTAELCRYGLTVPQAESFVQVIARGEHERELELATSQHVQIITCFDEAYPIELANIAYPPALLYCVGDVSLLTHDKRISVVGARAGDAYGKRAVQLIVPPLVQNGAVIISGGARGIDTFAHTAAVEAGGKTVVVLGSGLMEAYPPSNKELFKQIVYAGGAVISPFSLRMRPLAGNFPARNRIISGLCHELVVVQGERTSGAGITAAYGLEQGKTIYAVPGAIDSPLSSLPHYLLSQGAIVCTGPEAFGITKPVAAKTVQPQKLVNQLVELCRQPRLVSELVELTGLSESDLYQQLFELQCAGLIEQDVAGRYSSTS